MAINPSGDRSARRLATIWILALIMAPLAAGADNPRAVVVGGGPDPEHNQAAIESNVRYLLRLLPPGTQRTVLFADGSRQHETVLYEAQARDLTPADRMLALIAEGRDAAHPATLKYRAPTIPQIDGPSRAPNVAAAIGKLAHEQASASPVLLYFTGHGSPSRDRNLDNNVYDLWGDQALSVRDLASNLARLPAGQPVTVVMVQCFSGAFGNLVFENGDPASPPVDRDIAGFFATVKERMAAGCTPEVDESEYHDFTSYFFAALTGHDRVGRPVTGADYNGDGRVTMDEAFCYALIHDRSIDIPVCTSDVLLRRLVRTPDAEIFRASYADVSSWATPAQHAALAALSAALRLTGDDRGQAAYARFAGDEPRPDNGDSLRQARRTFGRAEAEARRVLFGRFPDLRDPMGASYAEARREARAFVQRNLGDPVYENLEKADADLARAEDADYRRELTDAQLTRFVRLFKTVVLTHAVNDSGDAADRQRLARLRAAESRPLFAPASAVALR